jgi:hypothetical protein
VKKKIKYKNKTEIFRIIFFYAVVYHGFIDLENLRKNAQNSKRKNIIVIIQEPKQQQCLYNTQRFSY